MKKYLLLSCVVSGYLYAEPSLDEARLQKLGDCFLEDLPGLLSSNKEEQEAYSFFYSKFLEQLSMMSDARRERKLQSVYRWATKSLHDKHLSFYQKLQRSGQFDPETQTKTTRKLLTRYAVYEKMHTVQEHNWQEIRQLVSSYSKRALVKVSKATNSLRKWLIS